MGNGAGVVVEAPTVLFAVWAAVTVAGCATDQGRFPIMSTKNVEVSRVDLKHIPFVRDVQGADGRFWFLFIPFGSSPTLAKAMDDCLKHGNGDFMTSARIESFFWSALLCSYESWRVTGDVGDSLGPGSR